MIVRLLAACAVATLYASAAQAQGDTTVQCVSRDYKYEECWASNLAAPQLIHQTSSAACIINRTWGYNPRSGYIWVAEGCAGVFADPSGYHHGRGDTFDEGARQYDNTGHDAGKVVAGAILGALLSSALSSKPHTTSNVPSTSDQRYSGCHGAGCLVTAPQSANEVIDTRPAFDKQGNPNFDTKGNYQGCHGMGCLVDNPDGD
jgi:hypothetical protein